MTMFQKKLALSALALSMTTAATAANSIQGATDFRVVMPEVLVLYHWDVATLNLTTNNQVVNDSTLRTTNPALGASSYTLTDDVATTGQADTLLSNNVGVTLKNAWAVRSIANNSVNLGLVHQNGNLKHTEDNSATIAISSPTLVSGTATNSGTANITIPSGWTPVMGDIKFTMDLSQATKPGQYNSRGTDAASTSISDRTFLLTLTGN